MSALFEFALAAAFIGGIAGGIHCAGMCGSIVHAVCARPGAGRGTWYLLAYNAGRIASYVCAGVLAGGLGEFGASTRGAPVVEPLLFGLASIMLIAMGLYLGAAQPLLARIEVAGAWLWRRIQPWTRHVLPVTSIRRALGLGALWGWLPCGMVYAVLLSALALGSWWRGGAIMLAFGLGTLPNLLGIALFSRQVGRLAARSPVRRVAGIAIAAFGLYGLVSVVSPGAAGADALFCRVVDGLGGWLQ